VLNKQRQQLYIVRRGLLEADAEKIADFTEKMYEQIPESRQITQAKQQELGEDVFKDIFRRLSLQILDMLWVEHLEVMTFTRSSVNLRAYGQRDPLIEYRKEGTRLFREMQEAVYGRIVAALPQVQPQVVQAQEEQRKLEAQAAQKSAGAQTAAKPQKSAPVTKEHTFGRNDLVTVTDGTDTQELKYKKAEPLLTAGWTVVEK